MKALFIVLALAYSAEAKSIPQVAQIQTRIQADSTQWKEYAGKYKGVEGAFESFIVTIEDGKLMAEAIGQGKGELLASPNAADTFTVPGYEATIVFVRDADKKVIKYQMSVQGQQFEGDKL